jgi:hypothetical protein
MNESSAPPHAGRFARLTSASGRGEARRPTSPGETRREEIDGVSEASGEGCSDY